MSPSRRKVKHEYVVSGGGGDGRERGTVSHETSQSSSIPDEGISVCLVGAGTGLGEQLTGHGFDVVDEASGDADCVVVADTAEADATTAEVWAHHAPVVLYGPDPAAVPNPARFAGYARTDDVDGLADQIRWVTARATTSARSPDDDRLETLHQGTVSLIEAETTADLFCRTVDIASRLLAFDSCYIAVAEAGLLVKQASVGDVADEPLSVDHGIVGRTYRTGESHLIDDTFTEPEAKPVRPTHRSGISVKVGDDAVLVVISDEPGAFDERDLGLAELLVRYTEGTLARIRSAVAIEEKRELVERLHEGTAALAGVTTIEDAARVAVELAEGILAFDTCYVGVREGDVIVPYAVSTDAPPGAARRLHVSEGVAGRTIRTGESQLVDCLDDEDARSSHEGYRSGISVPLGTRGVFQAVSFTEDAFDAFDLELAGLLADHLTGTFTRLRAEADVGRQRERVARLHAATAELIGCGDTAELYERTVETAQSVLGFDTAYILVADGTRFVPAAQVTHPDHERIGPVPIDHGVASQTHQERTSRLIDTFEDIDEVEPLQSASGGGISVPFGEDAVFQAVSRTPEAFDAFDLELAELLVSHAAASRDHLRAEAALRSQHDRLSALFENIPDAAVSYELVDDEPRVREVNPAFEETFGFARETIVGENLDEYIIPDTTETDAADLNARLRRGENIRTECRRQTAAGVRTFILQVVPLELGKRNVAGFAIYTDITERQEREHELRRQNERLEEFANIVSHDLRNPLSIASGYLDIAAETGDPEALAQVTEAISRMNRLVDDLLSLARKGQVVGETTTVDVPAVARRAWLGVETDGATLDLPETFTAEADEGRLVDLFSNLFANAVEHAGPGPTIRVEALDGAGFAVEDDGPGIPPERREQVLRPGETTGKGGIGYGLAIVDQIVEAHGWSLTVTDGDEGGARFEVSW